MMRIQHLPHQSCCEKVWESCEKVGAAMLRGQSSGPGSRALRQSVQLHDSSALTKQCALSLVFNLTIRNMWIMTSTSQVAMREDEWDKKMWMCLWIEKCCKTWGLVISIFIRCGVEQEMLFLVDTSRFDPKSYWSHEAPRLHVALYPMTWECDKCWP